MLDNIHNLESLERSKITEIFDSLKSKIQEDKETIKKLEEEKIELLLQHEKAIGILEGKLASEINLRTFIVKENQQTLSELKEDIKRYQSIEERSIQVLLSAVSRLSGGPDVKPISIGTKPKGISSFDSF